MKELSIEQKIKWCLGDRFSTKRLMPFGKYKGEPVLVIISENFNYMEWIQANCNFKLNNEEAVLYKEKYDEKYKRVTSNYKSPYKDSILWEDTDIREQMVWGDIISPWGADFNP